MSEEKKESQKIDFPYLAIIPFQVMSNQKISANTKLHFGCLTALSKKCGYCYATDEQLAKMHNVKERQIKRWHKELEENDFILRETKTVPYTSKESKLRWKKSRKIFIGDCFSKKVCEGDKKDTYNEGDKNVPLLKEETLNKNPINNKNVPFSPSPMSTVSPVTATPSPCSPSHDLAEYFLAKQNSFRNSIGGSDIKVSEIPKTSFKIANKLLKNSDGKTLKSIIDIAFNHVFWGDKLTSITTFERNFHTFEEIYLKSLIPKKAKEDKAKKDKASLEKRIAKHKAIIKRYSLDSKCTVLENGIKLNRGNKFIEFGSDEFLACANSLVQC